MKNLCALSLVAVALTGCKATEHLDKPLTFESKVDAKYLPYVGELKPFITSQYQIAYCGDYAQETKNKSVTFEPLINGDTLTVTVTGASVNVFTGKTICQFNEKQITHRSMKPVYNAYNKEQRKIADNKAKKEQHLRAEKAKLNAYISDSLLAGQMNAIFDVCKENYLITTKEQRDSKQFWTDTVKSKHGERFSQESFDKGHKDMYITMQSLTVNLGTLNRQCRETLAGTRALRASTK